MRAVTWSPGSDDELDKLFDYLREEQHKDKSHRLWQNYSKLYWDDAGIVANTISFNDEDEPEVCSTISSRTCWPKDVYRIYNRTWKCSNKKSFLKTVTPAMGLAGKSQIHWLKHNTNCKLHFISRQTDNWQQWMIDSFRKSHQITLKMDNYFYLTCPNCEDPSCWQRIIYNGSKKILDKWQRKVI